MAGKKKHHTMPHDTAYSEPHEVTGYLEGEWIKYECTLCDSKLKFNTKTKKIVSNAAEKQSEIRHTRIFSHLPPELFSINFSVSVGQKKAPHPAINIPVNLN